MSGPEDIAATVPPVLKRSALPKAIVAVSLVILLILGALIATTRYGVLTPQARLLIEARTDGLKIGRVGRLKVEGLSGDVWRDFRVRRLTIRDEKGVWLEANNVHLSWRYVELFRRRFVADLVEADTIRLIRRPTLSPKGKDRGLPVSFHIDRGRARVEALPAFSYERGVYDLAFNLDVARRGGAASKLSAKSVLHPGDHLDLDFAYGPTSPLRLVADAREARGGAIAGALGFSPDQPFDLSVRANGERSRGRFTAAARTGAVVPLLAEGAWTPEGGQAGGRILLAASALTASYAERLGPEVRFGVGGKRAPGGLFALDLRLDARNLTVRAAGVGDIAQRKLGPRGLQLDARTASLSKIVGGPPAGAARVTGGLTGEVTRWRFAGSASVADVAVGGYGLDRISGPVELAAGRTGVSLKTRLAGTGGRGSGYAAAILGGAPVAAIEGERLTDGRLALKRLDLTGRGLKLQATGGRSLLGALTFKGQAQVSNLAAAAPGAAGEVALTWNASQARAAAPWTFGLDAKGERFATGLAELDRLLGGSPRLEAQVNWQAGRLAVARASLDGAALDATTAGVMERDGTLAFKADWTASGPFHAGPVEIAGQARGTGGVTGRLAEPRLDLVADIDQLDVPRLPLTSAKLNLTFQRRADGSSGQVQLAAQSRYGPARARSAFRFPEGGVDLTDLAVDAGGLKASGALSLRANSPSAADLTLDVTRGAFLDAGRVRGSVRIADAPGGARARLDLTAESATPAGWRVTLRQARITADGPLARLPYVAHGEGGSTRGAWALDGRGILAEARPGYALSFDGAGKLGGRELRTAETASFRFGGGDTTARVRLAASDGGRIDLDSTLRDGAADVRARLAGLTLRLLDPDLEGRIDAALAIRGQGQRLDGTLDARLADARGRGAPAAQGLDGTIKAQLADSQLALQVVATNEQGLKAEGDVTLPAEASAAPFRVAIARQRPMRGRFLAEGEVRPLWDLLFGGERALAGYVRAQGTLAGTLADPAANGSVAVERGRFDDGATGLSLRDVTLKASFARNLVDITDARGVDGHGGQAMGSGRISLLRNGLSSFKLDLRNFRLVENEVATAAVTGPVTIARAADGKVKLIGDLTVDRADVRAEPPVPSGVVAMDVREVNRPANLPEGFKGARNRGSGWLLDVKLRAPRRVFLRGRGLDMELSLDAHVGGTSTRPDLSGTARVFRGDYDFAGKRFLFDDTSVVYLSSNADAIRLQLDAVREDPTLTVTVRIRGTATRPELTLASTPSLPDDEILSQVLFGRSASQLSGVEAAQLASAISAMAGGGGLDIVGNLRSFAGLDRLVFGGDDQSGVTISGGKYLTEDVYLELTGGGREGPSAQVEWRVRRHLSIISRLAGQAGNRLSVRWRKDY